MGGAGALHLGQYTGFGATFYFVAAAILAVTLLVVVPLSEPAVTRVAPIGSGLVRVGGEIRAFTREAWQAFTASRATWMGLLFAVLPAGALALGLSLANILAVDIGLDDGQVASLNFWTTLLAAAGCVAGGWLSDRFGRRRALALFIFSVSPVTLWLAWALWHAGWVHPVDPAQRTGAAPAMVITVFWLTSLLHALANGMVYGARAALFMDISSPRVAATQFTAYMALLNLGIAASASWQGWSVERYGYPLTLLADAIIGLLCLAFLAAMGSVAPRKDAAGSM